MSIGIDMRLLGMRHGGIGRYTFEIARHILEEDPEREYLLFFNTKDADPRDMEYFRRFPNARHIAAPVRHYSAGEQTSFLRIVNRHKPALMHFPNFNVPYLYRRPFIITLHDVVHHKISGAKKSRLFHFWAYKKIIERAVRQARHIITVSEFSKGDISAVLGVKPEKITVVYEGTTLDPEVPPARVTEIKKQFLINRPYFLFVGVLERKKNLVSLTRGFDAFIKKYQTDADLVIVGKADRHYPDIKHHAMDIINRDRLVFTGFVGDAELAALYRGAYAYVSASLHEGFGLPGVEAMRFGLPLVVSNLPVFNEIYDNAAVYFDPLDPGDIAEKLHLLARDAQFYGQLQKNAVIRGELFDWRKAARETIQVYNSILP